MGQRAFEAESAPQKPGGGVGESQPAAGERHAEGGGFDVDGGAEAKDGEPSPGQGAFQRPVGEVEADPGHTLSESGPCAKVSAAGLFAQGLMPPTSRESIDRAITPPPAPRCGPSPPTYYFWMNTRRAPFDDVKVRQAINYAVDPEVLRDVYDEQLAPTHQILPPNMPGYRRFDLYPHNMATARRLVREADPSDRDITVWTDGESPNYEAGAYYQIVLRELGFHVELKILGPDSYFEAIGNDRTPNLDTGFADWFEDYPHPNDFFGPLLAEKPTPFYTNNFSRFVDPRLGRRVADLDEEGTRPIDEAAYARLDRDYMKLAPIVPFGTRRLVASFSKAVDLRGFVWSPTFETDLTSLRFKPEAAAGKPGSDQP